MINEHALAKAAVYKFGKDNQLSIATEECGELIQAISKYRRTGDTQKLMQEIADVEIMIEQLKIIVGEDMVGYVDIKKKQLEKLRGYVK